VRREPSLPVGRPAALHVPLVTTVLRTGRPPLLWRRSPVRAASTLLPSAPLPVPPAQLASNVPRQLSLHLNVLLARTQEKAAQLARVAQLVSLARIRRPGLSPATSALTPREAGLSASSARGGPRASIGLLPQRARTVSTRSAATLCAVSVSQGSTASRTSPLLNPVPLAHTPPPDRVRAPFALRVLSAPTPPSRPPCAKWGSTNQKRAKPLA